MPPVDTKKSLRRTLRFNSIADARAEVDRLVAADKAGTLRFNGNWTLGQMLGHVAGWADFAYKGFPMGPSPWFVRLMLKFMRTKFLSKGFPAGIRMPNVEAGTYNTEILSTEEGARRLYEVLDRMERREAPKYPSPAFGPMTTDEFIQGTLRHAELHLGFVQLN